jgi:hypothetical protein
MHLGWISAEVRGTRSYWQHCSCFYLPSSSNLDLTENLSEGFHWWFFTFMVKEEEKVECVVMSYIGCISLLVCVCVCVCVCACVCVCVRERERVLRFWELNFGFGRNVPGVLTCGSTQTSDIRYSVESLLISWATVSVELARSQSVPSANRVCLWLSQP